MRRNAMQCSCSFEGLRSGLSSETGRQDVAMGVGGRGRGESEIGRQGERKARGSDTFAGSIDGLHTLDHRYVGERANSPK